MPSWTAFVDESGLFEPSAGGWLPGMRLVAGVVLPLPVAQAEQRCQQALQAARTAFGSGSWPVTFHGSRLAHPAYLAEEVLASPLAPRWLRVQAEQVATGPTRLQATGHRLLRLARQEVGRAIGQSGGWALGVCEFGCPTTLRGEPGPLPYRRMLVAWLDHALMELACQLEGPTTLDVVVASRSQPVPAHQSAWGRRLEALGDPRSQVELQVREAAASELAGLQAADLLAHALGPGSQQAIPPSAATVTARTGSTLAATVAQRFGPSLRYVERDALTDARLVNEATQALGRSQRFDAVAARARTLPPPELPPGHFPASLETCAVAVPALRRLWP